MKRTLLNQNFTVCVRLILHWYPLGFGYIQKLRNKSCEETSVRLVLLLLFSKLISKEQDTGCSAMCNTPRLINLPNRAYIFYSFQEIVEHMLTFCLNRRGVFNILCYTCCNIYQLPLCRWVCYWVALCSVQLQKVERYFLHLWFFFSFVSSFLIEGSLEGFCIYCLILLLQSRTIFSKGKCSHIRLNNFPCHPHLSNTHGLLRNSVPRPFEIFS